MELDGLLTCVFSLSCELQAIIAEYAVVIGPGRRVALSPGHLHGCGFPRGICANPGVMHAYFMACMQQSGLFSRCATFKGGFWAAFHKYRRILDRHFAQAPYGCAVLETHWHACTEFVKHFPDYATLLDVHCPTWASARFGRDPSDVSHSFCVKLKPEEAHRRWNAMSVVQRKDMFTCFIDRHAQVWGANLARGLSLMNYKEKLKFVKCIPLTLFGAFDLRDYVVEEEHVQFVMALAKLLIQHQLVVEYLAMVGRVQNRQVEVLVHGVLTTESIAWEKHITCEELASLIGSESEIKEFPVLLLTDKNRDMFQCSLTQHAVSYQFVHERILGYSPLKEPNLALKALVDSMTARTHNWMSVRCPPHLHDLQKYIFLRQMHDRDFTCGVCGRKSIWIDRGNWWQTLRVAVNTPNVSRT